jgi:hypothetical protein
MPAALLAPAATAFIVFTGGHNDAHSPISSQHLNVVCTCVCTSCLLRVLLSYACSVMYFLCFTALAVLCTQAMAAANSRCEHRSSLVGVTHLFTDTLSLQTQKCRSAGNKKANQTCAYCMQAMAAANSRCGQCSSCLQQLTSDGDTPIQLHTLALLPEKCMLACSTQHHSSSMHAASTRIVQPEGVASRRPAQLAVHAWVSRLV